MNKKYVKPAMAVETIEASTLICMSFQGNADLNAEGLSKRRNGAFEEEDVWEEGTDLWGNDCRNRID